MKKYLFFIPCLLLTVFVNPEHGFAPRDVLAAQGNHHEVPLAVLRFNQPRVYFKRPVSQALQKAQQIKPDLSVDIIHYTPPGSGPRADKAKNDLNSVVRMLYGMGFTTEQIGITRKVATNLPHSEVHLYVR